MGLFGIFGGKSPEEIEVIGDGYFKAEEYGAAKIEYEKALQKAQKKSPEKTVFIQNISEKITKSKESLALFHEKTAESLILSKNYEEAEGLLQLAQELTEKDQLKEKLTLRLNSIRKEQQQKEKIHWVDSHENEEISIRHFEEGEGVKNIDDYFSVLCSALPEDINEKYHSYGEAFKSGYVALNSGDFETAARQLGKAAADNPSPHTLIPIELATALIHLGRIDEAEDLLVQYIHDNPVEPRSYHVLCEVYWDKNAHDHAMELLQECPTDIKDTLPIQMLLGETLYLKGDYEEAVNLFSKSLTAFGFNELIARSLAKTHEVMGDIKQARDLYGKIISGCQSCGSRIDPFVKSRYAELSFRSGDKSTKLLETYFSLVQEDPDNKYQYYQHIYRIYEDMGNIDQARRYQAMAEAVAP